MKLGKPAEIRKTLPTKADTITLKAVQEQAKQNGMDVEAVQGISPDEYWVSISLPSSRSNPEFAKWIQDTNPSEASELERRLVGSFLHGKSIVETRESRKRFLPFKNIADAEKFINTGDTSLIAKGLEFRGQPMTPPTPAQTITPEGAPQFNLKRMQAIIDTEIKLNKSTTYTKDLLVIKKKLDRVAQISKEVGEGNMTPLAATIADRHLFSEIDNDLQDLKNTHQKEFNTEIWEVWQRYQAIEMGFEKKSDALEILARDVGMAMGEEEIKNLPYERGGRKPEGWDVSFGEEAKPPTVAPETAVTPPGRAPPTVPPRREAPRQWLPDDYIAPRDTKVVEQELYEAGAEIGGLEGYIEGSTIRDLVNLVKKTGKGKGEIPNITIKQYKELSGRDYVPEFALTKDRKHVLVERTFDSFAPERGYADADALVEAIIQLKEDLQKITELKYVENKLIAELRGLEEQESIKDQVQEFLETTIEQGGAFEASLSDLRGAEAKSARLSIAYLLEALNKAKVMSRNAGRLPNTSVLIQQIRAWSTLRGIPRTTMEKIYVASSKQALLNRMNESELQDALVRVKIARPATIEGKKVITHSTESRIGALKADLIAKNQMTEGDYKKIKSDLGLLTEKFESRFLFITEGQGKKFRQALLDEVTTIEDRLKVEQGLEKNPDIRERVRRLDKRIGVKRRIVINGTPQVKVTAFQDMRYYVMGLQAKTGKPFYDAWQKMNENHLIVRSELTRQKEELQLSTPKYKKIAGDEEALKRVEEYIRWKAEVITEKPTNLQEGEQPLGEAIYGILLRYRGMSRMSEFLEGYALYGDDVQSIKDNIIPSATLRNLREAVKVYEGKGREELLKHLSQEEDLDIAKREIIWETRETGLDPLSIINTKDSIRRAQPKPLVAGDIQTKQDIEYTKEDKNILLKLKTYSRQMYNKVELQPDVRRLLRVYDTNKGQLENPRKVASELTRAINETFGYPESGGALNHAIARLYTQTMSAVFLDPSKWVRNKFQNLAFHPDRLHYFDKGFRKLENMPEDDTIYFHTFVSQQNGLIEDYLMQDLSAYPGFRSLTRLANRVSQYAWTDKSNRSEAFKMRSARVEEALATYEIHKDIDRLMQDSGLGDLEPIQQREALRLLAQDTVSYNFKKLKDVSGKWVSMGLPDVSGKEAYRRYVAKEVTNNVHWLYERAQRAPAEMGSSGKVLGNLMVFPRSYIQRLTLLSKKAFDPNAPSYEKRYARKHFVGLLIISALVGAGEQYIVGKKSNPYFALQLLSWAPGGLVLGATDEISATISDMFAMATGDKEAINRLTTSLPRVARLTIPFYKEVVSILETITDTKNLDRYALRKLRELVDKEYTVLDSAYKTDRGKWYSIQRAQHILFGGETIEIEEPYDLHQINPIGGWWEKGEGTSGGLKRGGLGGGGLNRGGLGK